MSGQPRHSTVIAEALNTAKSPGEMPAQSSQVLERALADTWQRIRGHPDSYIMTEQEATLMLFFSERHKTNATYNDALRRFWSKKHGSSTPVNGGSRGGGSSSK